MSDIEYQLMRLCEADSFFAQERPREILNYLVAEALAGRVPEAADVAAMLGRPNLEAGDSYVRTSKNRLANRLEEYYSKRANPGEIRFAIREYIVFANRKRTGPPVTYDGPPSVSILEPAENGDVDMRPTVRGTIDVLNPDLRVWLIVLAPDGFYYPQGRVSRRSRVFQTTVRIGTVEWGASDGTKFEILLVSADVDGDYRLHAYMERRGDGFGRELPLDVQVLAVRKVVRRDIQPNPSGIR